MGMLPTKFQAVWGKGERNIMQAGEQQDFNLICNKNILFSFNKKNILEANKRNMSNCQFWMGFILVCILISVFLFFYIFQFFLKMKM